MQRAGPLARWDDGPLPVFASDDRALTVLGYGDAAIQSVIAQPTLVADAPLTGAATCDPRLPAPIWSARWEPNAGGLVAAPIASPPPLTAPWIDTTCRPTDDIWVDVDCKDVRCAVVTNRAGCGVSLDLTECGFDRPRATLTPGGGMCLDFSATPLTCAPLAPPTGAAAASTCDTGDSQCNLTWYTERMAIDMAERRIRLDLDQRPFRAANADAGPAISPSIFAKGYAWDLAPIGRGALITGPGRDPVDGCNSQAKGTLYVLDGDRGTVVDTATAPPCLLRIVASEEDDVIGLYAEGGDWRLGHFDAAGHLHGSVPADPRPMGDATSRRPDVAEWRVVSLVRGRNGWIAIWDRFSTSLVFTYDRALRPVARLEISDRYVTGAVDIDDTTLALLTNESGEVIYANPVDGSTTRRTTLLARNGAVMLAATGLYTATRDGDALIVTSGIPSMLYTIGRTMRAESRAQIYDANTTPHDVLPLPWDPSKMLVVGVTFPRGATLSLYLPEERRFLPATRDLSPSPASRVIADPHGRIWILLSWIGEAVILEKP